jgi:protein ImuA
MRDGSPVSLHQLRHATGIAAVSAAAEPSALPLGVGSLDRALGGGLARGACHEISPAGPFHLGAAAGFALTLAALIRRDRPMLWIQTDFAAAEGGTLYGPGLDLIGLAMERLVILRVPRPVDVLWAKEEALKSRALAAVLAELPEDGAVADLTATRRLSLAAREGGGGLGLLLRQRASPRPSAAATRWEVAAAPSESDENGLGRTAFALTLTRNRRGPCGRWIVRWDHHERAFLPALPLGVAETARDRSDRALVVRAG